MQQQRSTIKKPGRVTKTLTTSIPQFDLKSFTKPKVYEGLALLIVLMGMFHAFVTMDPDREGLVVEFITVLKVIVSSMFSLVYPSFDIPFISLLAGVLLLLVGRAREGGPLKGRFKQEFQSAMRLSLLVLFMSLLTVGWYFVQPQIS